MRVFTLWLKEHKKGMVTGFSALLVPAIAVFMFVVLPQEEAGVPIDVMVAEARVAQAEEVQNGANSIYHTKVQITEGSDKPEFVKVAMNSEVTNVTPRTDVIETWHHSDTALALIESNGTERTFEAFLSREHEDGLALHHYGPKNAVRSEARAVYDSAHDLASLYTSFTSLDRPEISVMPHDAEFIAYNEDKDVLTFMKRTDEGLEIEYDLSGEDYQVFEERIYVVTEEDRYEMTRVTFLERSIIDANQFDEVFDPSQYDYQLINT